MRIVYPDAFAVIAGDTPEGEVAALRRYFREVIRLPPDPMIASPTAHHPDMLFSVIGDRLFTHDGYYGGAHEVIDRICALGGFTLTLSSMARGKAYPFDIGFNGLVFGDILLGKLSHLSPELLSHAAERGMRTVSVKQGYTACSTLALPAVGLAATSDIGIADALEGCGAAVVRLSADLGIGLPGYDHGFIGGSAGVWEDAVFFTGDPLVHDGLADLCDLLRGRGMRVVSLSAGRLTDRGGVRIFPVKA